MEEKSITTTNNLPVSLDERQKKIAFIIGNGFNFLVENIVKKFPLLLLPEYLSLSKNEIADNIREISVLWKKFDILFKELKDNYPKVSDEELIRMIYTVIDFFSGLPAFEKILSPSTIASLKSVFDVLLIERIREIAEEFRQHQSSQGYKDIKRLFPYFGDNLNKLLIDNNIKSCAFFTTNYDGVLDTLLTTGNGKGFLSVDGFGNDPNIVTHLRLYNDYLEYKPIKIIHIHGSYRFEKKYGDTFKTRSIDQQNMEPVIIFNNPQQKENLIRRDPVLSHYFSYMADFIRDADTLVILGNSMVNEPHVKKLISSKFNEKNKKIVVCSRHPSEITSQLTGIYNGVVIEKDTSGVNYIEDLLSLIQDITAM